MSIGLRELATIAVRHRSAAFWHKDGTVDAMVAAAEAVMTNQAVPFGRKEQAVINAMKRELKAREFICNFDDPCDVWAA
jgi:hypothetical protein